MIEFRRGDLSQKLAILDAVADVDVALVDIAAGAGEDVGLGESRGGARQGDEHGLVARLDRGDMEARHEIGLPLRGGRNLAVLRLVAPGAEGERRQRGPAARRARAIWRPKCAACAEDRRAPAFRGTALLPAYASCPTTRSRSLDALLEYAMVRLAVIALPQHCEEIGHDEQSGRSSEQQPADDGAGQGRVLLLAGAADRHRQHADHHRGCRHQYRANPGVAGVDRGLEGVLARKLLFMGKRHEQDGVRRSDANGHDRAHQ